MPSHDAADAEMTVGRSQIELKTAAGDAIAAYGGDPMAAVRALLITVDYLQDRIDRQDRKLRDLAGGVSSGYTRGHWQNVSGRLRQKSS